MWQIIVGIVIVILAVVVLIYAIWQIIATYRADRAAWRDVREGLQKTQKLFERARNATTDAERTQIIEELVKD